MDYQILVIYCICDDLLKVISPNQNRQVLMNDSEIMTTALVSALFFGGNFESARSFLKSPRYIPKMLSKSRFNRLLHRINDVFLYLLQTLGEMFKDLNEESCYLIDSFPVAVCDNIRIKRCKIYRSSEYHGYISSKRRYFYGLRIHLMVTKNGQPV